MPPPAVRKAKREFAVSVPNLKLGRPVHRLTRGGQMCKRVLYEPEAASKSGVKIVCTAAGGTCGCKCS